MLFNFFLVSFHFLFKVLFLFFEHLVEVAFHIIHHFYWCGCYLLDISHSILNCVLYCFVNIYILTLFISTFFFFIIFYCFTTLITFLSLLFLFFLLYWCCILFFLLLLLLLFFFRCGLLFLWSHILLLHQSLLLIALYLFPHLFLSLTFFFLFFWSFTCLSSSPL